MEPFWFLTGLMVILPSLAAPDMAETTAKKAAPPHTSGFRRPVGA